MMEALYNGVSGIKTNQFGIDVTGNNIANTSTVGYKNSQAEFKDIFYQTNIVGGYNPVASSVGLGSTVAGTAIDFEEGSFQNTDNTFDMAIAGDGFFAVSGVDGSTYYTRAGQFSVDVKGDLVNSSGHYLMGTTAALSDGVYSEYALKRLGNGAAPNALVVDLNSNLEFAPTQSKINLPQNLYIPSEPTSQVDLKGILTTQQEYAVMDAPLNMENASLEIVDNKANLSASVLDTPAMKSFSPGSEVKISFTNEAGDELQARTTIRQDGSFAINDFDLSYLADETGSLEGIKYSAITQRQVEQPVIAKFSVGIEGGNGYENKLTINLTRQTPNKPEGGADWDAVATITDQNGNELSRATGVLSFNGVGALTGNTIGALNNGGTPVTLNLGSFYDPNIPNSGFDGLTMQDAPTQTTAVQTDGRKDGILRNYAIGEDGMIMALFDNGFQAAVARVPLFHFQNDQGLYTEGGVFFSPTSNSGEPFMLAREDGTKYNGSKILGNMLENSNVDIANELTMLIVQQRAYEASAKSITTSDQMLQKAINMKN